MSSRKVWRHVMQSHEQKLWNVEEMKGWRNAFQAFVEDTARDHACTKYMILDRNEEVVFKGEVQALPQPVET